MTQTQVKADVERPVPAWVGIAVVVLCLACGGGFLWWYMREPLPGAGEVIPDPDRQVARAPNRVNRPRVTVNENADGIRASAGARGTTYTVKANAGKSLMDVDRSSAANPYSFRYQ